MSEQNTYRGGGLMPRPHDPVTDSIYATLNDRANYTKITPYEISIFSTASPIRPASKRRNTVSEASTTPYQAGIRSIDVSTKRTKQTVRMLFNSNKRALLTNAARKGQRYSPAFITCTLKSDVDVRPDEALTEFGRFARKLKRQYGDTISYVSVVELHKSGRPHIHAVVSGIPVHILKAERENRTIAQLWGNGYVDVRIIEKPTIAVGYYMVKYITKEMIAVSKGKKRYGASRNLDYPVKHFVHSGNIADFLKYVIKHNYELSTLEYLQSPFFGDYIKVALTKRD